VPECAARLCSGSKRKEKTQVQLAKFVVSSSGAISRAIMGLSFTPTANQRTPLSRLVGWCNLKCTGTRTRKRYPRVVGPSRDYTYVVVEQGIFSTNTPIIADPPQIREGMCGAPLLRIEKNGEDSSADGEVCGFFLWADLKGYNGPVLHSYCQSVDPLIEAGWVCN
jgi:hypothetical protein